MRLRRSRGTSLPEALGIILISVITSSTSIDNIQSDFYYGPQRINFLETGGARAYARRFGALSVLWRRAVRRPAAVPVLPDRDRRSVRPRPIPTAVARAAWIPRGVHQKPGNHSKRRGRARTVLPHGA